MSFFSGADFFIMLGIAVIPAIVLGLLEMPLRWYFLPVSLWFLFLVFRSDQIQLLYLILFYLLAMVVVKGYLYLRRKYGKNRLLYGSAIFLSILPLALCKVSGKFGIGIFAFLGISYLTFRVVQVVIETYDGLITEISFLDMTGFLLLFPSFSSGPIDRSRRFSKDFHTVYPRSEYLELLGDGLQKILLGLVYKLVLSSVFYSGMERFTGGFSNPVNLFGYMYSYGFYLFFDFAGYSLMAIGTAYIFGIRLPDNFNKPFLSLDIKDFWNRWHISLSHWFRDFVFSRFMMQAIRKKWFHRNRLTAASVGFILNMLLMGIWHGLSVSYIFYGLYHGVLLAVTEVYQKKSKFYAAHKNAVWYKVLSWFVTLNLVMVGFFIFSGKALEIVARFLH